MACLCVLRLWGGGGGGGGGGTLVYVPEYVEHNRVLFLPLLALFSQCDP